MTTLDANPPVHTPEKLVGIAGWLVFPAIGAALAPFVIAFQTFQTASAFQYLGQVNGAMGAFIVLEVIANVGLLALACYLAYVFFKRKRNAPKVYITFLAVSLVLQVVDLAIASGVFHLTPDAGDSKALGRSLMGAIVWIPYMLISKRVKATFTE